MVLKGEICQERYLKKKDFWSKDTTFKNLYHKENFKDDSIFQVYLLTDATAISLKMQEIGLTNKIKN